MATTQTPTSTTDRIDIFDTAISSHAGDPIAATLFNVDFNVRRDYTADEVRQYIEYFNLSKWDADNPPSPEEQIRFQLGFLTDLNDEEMTPICEQLLEADVTITGRILIHIGKIAGLRTEEGNFTTGRRR